MSVYAAVMVLALVAASGYAIYAVTKSREADNVAPATDPTSDKEPKTPVSGTK